MGGVEPSSPDHPRVRPEALVAVDGFLGGLVEAQALGVALGSGVVDRLDDGTISSVDAVEAALVSAGFGDGLLSPRGLVDLLVANRVIAVRGGTVEPTADFRAALAHRELLESKIHVGCLAASDLASEFGPMVRDHAAFARRSAAFAYFGYGHATTADGEAVARARPWATYLTALSRYEVPVVADLHDFSAYRRLLDVGGNTGELAVQMCARHPGLEATVFDLPAVAAVAAERIRGGGPGTDRMTVVGGDATADPLPSGHDVVVMKSFLHDWSDRNAATLLRAADAALPPGGTIVVVERSGFGDVTSPVPFADWPMYLYSVAMPGPERYVHCLERLGYEVSLGDFHIDTPWFLLVATKT